MGTQQSGTLDLRIADLSRDAQLVILARDEARSLLELDPRLDRPQHLTLKEILRDILKSRPDWRKIA